MTRSVDLDGPVTGGVDTHKDVHVAVVIDEVGRVLGTESFPTTVAGHRQLLAWMQRNGQIDRIGVEGTGAYGAGLARLHLDANSSTYFTILSDTNYV